MAARQMAKHNYACDYLGIASNNNSSPANNNNNNNSANCSLVNTHTHKQIKLRQTERQKCKCHNKNNKYHTVCVCVSVCMCESYFSNQTKSRRPLTRTARHKNNAQCNQSRWQTMTLKKKCIGLHIANFYVALHTYRLISISALH